MTVKHLTIDGLARVALAGGGLRLAAGQFTVDQLARVALAGNGKGARVTIENSSALTVDDMARLALAGKGCVSFE